MCKNKKLLIHTWTAYYSEGKYYLPYMHWIYLDEIKQYFSKISLIVPVGKINDVNDLILMNFPNVEILSVPFYSTYKGALKTFFHYLCRYYFLSQVDVVYSRYPAPFGWLQKVFFKNKKRIIHYVGDPLDAALHNPNFSKIKKTILTTLFIPENRLFLWACKGAKVFTNGFDIAEKLKLNNINAQPLISSTLIEEDFYFTEKNINSIAPKIIYIGYLRTAKGVETIIRAFNKFLNDYPEAILSIVGEGEFEYDLKKIVNSFEIEKSVIFYGFIDDRKRLNSLLRNHDLFCFASLSEGSPRVILEAMANGINVLSTPVGSLPIVFADNKEIIFAKFNNENDFYFKMIEIFKKPEKMSKIRLEAFNKVKKLTIKNFIKSIFEN